MDQLQTATAGTLYPSVQKPALGGLELLFEVGGLVEPDQRERTGIVLETGLEHGPPPPSERTLANPAYAPDQRGVLARTHFIGRYDPASVLVAKGKMIEKVFDGLYAALGEHFAAPWPYSFDELYGVVELHALSCRSCNANTPGLPCENIRIPSAAAVAAEAVVK